MEKLKVFHKFYRLKLVIGAYVLTLLLICYFLEVVDVLVYVVVSVQALGLFFG